MNLLSSFMVISFNGGDRISFTFDEVDADTGNIISANNKESFVVTTSDVREAIETIREFIRTNKLAD